MNGAQFKQLQNAIQSAFPNNASLRIMVRIGLNENLESIAGDHNLSQTVFELIGWAEAQGRLEELVQQAYDANPGNPELSRFAAQFLPNEKMGNMGKPSVVTDASQGAANTGSAGMSAGSKRFQIALSFPGEYRTFIKEVANSLSSALGQEHVLYDQYYEAEFARPDLDTYLQALYHDQSELIAMFLCKEYEQKEWCGLEWRAIRDLLKRRQAATIMPFRFDNTEVPGLFSIDGYVWIAGRSAQVVADLILARLQFNAGTPPLPAPVTASSASHGVTMCNQPIAPTFPTESYDRNAFIGALGGLTNTQLSQVIQQVLGAENQVSETGSVAERVVQFVRYAESAVGPGLEEVYRVVKQKFPNFHIHP